MHHIAFEVDDIKAEMARLKSEGFVLLNDEPRSSGRIISWFALCIRKVQAEYLWSYARKFMVNGRKFVKQE